MKITLIGHLICSVQVNSAPLINLQAPNLNAPSFFSTVIQGDVDVKEGLSEGSLRQTIDFCTQAFEPASLEDWHKESDNSKTEEDEISEEAKEKAAQRMADVVAAKKTLRAEDMFHIGKFVADTFNGFSIRFEKGRLGLELRAPGSPVTPNLQPVTEQAFGNKLMNFVCSLVVVGITMYFLHVARL